MRFVICGTMLPIEAENKLPGASPATGKFLRNLKAGLENCGQEVYEFSYVAIPGAEAICKDFDVDVFDMVFKDRTIIKSVLEYQKRILKFVHCDDIVLFYDVVYYHIGLVDKLKRRGIKALLILADFSDSFMDYKNILRWLLSKRIGRDIYKFNYGVILSEKAKKFFNNEASIITIEGGIDYSRFADIENEKYDDVVRIMYAGSYTRTQGVDTFLSAIDKIEDDKHNRLEFYISGKGNLENLVKEASSRDGRIKNLGFLPDEEYYQVMKKIDVFINPRNMSLSQNQYNFPSKVLEYLATGRKVISTRFPGYERFIDNFYFYDGDERELSQLIIKTVKEINSFDRAMPIDFFDNNRKKAATFDWAKQAQKIIELSCL